MRHAATFALGLAAGVLLALLLTHPATSRQASAPRPAVVTPLAIGNEGTPAADRGADPPAPTASPTTRTGPASVEPVADPTPSATPRPTRRPRAATRPADGLRGTATWFAAPEGTAAAGPALRAALGEDWRGSRVRVCSGGECITVQLTDWCACGDRHGEPTVIDLGADSFARLAPLSAGVIDVVIR